MVNTIKNCRLKCYDYSSTGYYFITICSNWRNDFTENQKTIIVQHINKISTISDGIKLDYYSLLNNHLHMILILSQCKMRLGEIVRRFKAKTSKDSNCKLWQSNYYEHVIRQDTSLNLIREYIQNNPLKEKIDWNEIY